MANITKEERARRAAEKAAQEAAAAAALAAGLPPPEVPPEENTDEDTGDTPPEPPPVEQGSKFNSVAELLATTSPETQAAYAELIAQDAAECDKLRQTISAHEGTIRDLRGEVDYLLKELEAEKAKGIPAATVTPGMDNGCRVLLFGAAGFQFFTASGYSGKHYQFSAGDFRGVACMNLRFGTVSDAVDAVADITDYGRRPEKFTLMLLPFTAEDAAEHERQKAMAEQEALAAHAAVFKEVCDYRAAQGFPPVATYAEHEADMEKRRAAQDAEIAAAAIITEQA